MAGILDAQPLSVGGTYGGIFVYRKNITKEEARAKYGPSPWSGKVLILPGWKPVPSEAPPPRAQPGEVETGVQLLEERLGVEVDRNDPMRPAIGQMEVELQRMIKEKTPDQE